MYFVDQDGNILEGEDEQAAAKQGLRPATPEDLAKHNEDAAGVRATREDPFGSALKRVGSGLTALPGRILQGAADIGLPPEATSLLFGLGGPQAVEQYSQLPEADQGAPLYPGLLPEDERAAAKSQIQGFQQEYPTAALATDIVPGLAAGLAAAPAAAAGGALGIAADIGIGSILGGTSTEATAAYVEDREFSAEAAMANVALEAVFGGAIAGGIVGAKALAGGAAGRGARAVSEKAGELKTSLLGRARRKATEGVEPDAFLPADVRRGVGNSAGAAAEGSFEDVVEGALREIADGSADEVVVDLAAKELSSGGDWSKHLAEVAANRWDEANELGRRLTTAGNKVDDFFDGSQRWTELEVEAQDRLIAGVNERGRKLLEKVKQIHDDPDESLGTYTKTIAKDLDRHTRELAVSEGVERNYALDQFKRRMDQHVTTLTDAASRSKKYEMPDVARVQKMVREYADDLRDSLQSTSAWGQNAVAQRAQNAAWHKLIEPLKRIEKQLFERLDREYGELGAQAMRSRAKPEAIHALMKQDPALKGRIMGDLQQALDGRAELAAARDNYGFTNLEGLDEIGQALDDVKAAFNNQSVIERALKRYRELGSPKPPEGPGSPLPTAVDVGLDLAGGGGAVSAGRAIGWAGKLFKYVRNRQGKLVPRMAKPTENLGRVMSDATNLIGRTPRLQNPDAWLWLQRDMRDSLEAHGFRPPTGRPPSGGGPSGSPPPPPPTPQPPPVRTPPDPNFDASASPVDLSGLSLKDLGQLDRADTLKPETLSALRTGKGGYGDFAKDFARTGRVNQAGQVEQGIQIEIIGEGNYNLRDGRNRLVVGREMGLPALYGQVYQGMRAPGKKPIYEGMIPIGKGATVAASGAGVLAASGQAQASPVDHVEDVGRMATVESLNDIANGWDARITQASKGIVRGLSDPPDGLRQIYSAERPHVLERFAQGGDPLDRFESIERAIQEFTADPVRFIEGFAEGWGDLAAQEPEVYAAMAQKGQDILRYLTAVMPRRRGQSFSNREGWPPSIDEIEAFAGHFQGATDPMSVAVDMQYAEPSTEAIEAMRANWPGFNMRLAISAVAALEDTEEPTQVQLERVDRYFGLGAMLDPRFDPKLAIMIEQAEQTVAQEQQQKAQQKRPLNIDFNGHLAPPTRRTA